MAIESYTQRHLVLEAKKDIVEIMRIGARMSLTATPEQKVEFSRLLKEIKEAYDEL